VCIGVEQVPCILLHGVVCIFSHLTHLCAQDMSATCAAALARMQHEYAAVCDECAALKEQVGNPKSQHASRFTVLLLNY